MHYALKFNLKKLTHPIATIAWRVVEDQSIATTRKLVDSFAEHEILEQLIDSVKPKINLPKEFNSLHYLFFTPFRYPPLKYGSRFGSITEPSLWYGSDTVNTALSEVAFYRLYFLRGSSADFGITEIRLTAFAADIATKDGLDLTKPPFAEYNSDISSPTSYSVSQPLGTKMRENNITAFKYIAARSINPAVNIALFSPKAFKYNKPKTASWQTWICIATKQTVEFYARRKLDFPTQIFAVENFMTNGKFPII